jgi:spermidine synthase
VPEQQPPAARRGNATDRVFVERALLVVSLLSGCAALVYQIVWFQMLSVALGASALSLGLVPAVFLGGMCLGSVLAPRIGTLAAHPLRIYALLEVGIGALGLAALATVPAIGELYTTSVGSWADDGAAGDVSGIALRIAAAALVLLPSTVLLGATLPVVARVAPQGTRGAAWLGYFYAANIAGAVVGCMLAAFYLLRAHDARVATLVAVGLNVAVAIASSRLAARIPRGPLNGGIEARGAAPWQLYVATALSGACSLSAEVLWTRHLSLLFGATVYAFALILAVFLLGLGLGSAAGAAWSRRADPRVALGVCQLLSVAAMAWAAYAIARSLPYWPIDVTLPATAQWSFELDLLRTAYAVLPAALLWGASFPLALAAAAPPTARTASRLYAANTAGAIIGALATAFVLVVLFGSRATQQVLLAAAACSGLLLLLRPRPTRRSITASLALAAAAVAAIVTIVLVPALPPALVAYGRFLPARGAGANVVYVGEGLTASVAVTREPDGTLTYHNAGKTQASTYPQDLRLQRMLGHLATLVPEQPDSVLVIGLGAGITAGAVSADPAVRRVVVAEIEPLVPHVAREHFAEHNFGVVTDPKVEIVIDDGRHLLATTRERFDAITSDPLDPWVKGAAALYTREFWELCKRRLNEGGVVTAFLQLYESGDDAVKSAVATFFAAFPNGALLANTVEGSGYDAVLVGLAGDARIDLDRMQGRLDSGAYARVARSLRDVGFESALDIASTYAGQAVDLTRWLEGAAINTDRDLRLQYLAGAELNEQRAAEIFAALSAHPPRFPSALFTGSPARLEELRQRIVARQSRY